MDREHRNKMIMYIVNKEKSIKVLEEQMAMR